MRVVVGIPARMGSSRFPGKPLKQILGVPMVQHVYERCRLAENVDDLFVATCDTEIAESVDSFGGRWFMTDPDIPRPGLRVAEAVKQQDLADDDIVVVVQGDEPLVHPEMIEVAVQALLDDAEAPLGTLVADANEAEWQDPNEVKVVANLNGDLMYMTRSPVPSNTRDRFHRRLKQVAIMPFRKKFLLDFNEMAETPLEIDESVELVRALEHGVRVKAIESPYRSVSVDTEPDRQEAETAMRDDPFFPRYSP
ncbi:MAG: 3-deoxy-manno-octulosonate cytidylyltransferase [Gaiellaceae bacterium]